MPCAIAGFSTALAKPLVVLDEEVDVSNSDKCDLRGRWVNAKNNELIHTP